MLSFVVNVSLKVASIVHCKKNTDILTRFSVIVHILFTFVVITLHDSIAYASHFFLYFRLKLLVVSLIFCILGLFMHKMDCLSDHAPLRQSAY